jgi:hypothetical protein
MLLHCFGKFSIFYCRYRDFTLVEKAEEDAETGIIRFASRSVNLSKFTKTSAAVRGHLRLNGWILEPLVCRTTHMMCTKLTYLLDANVKGMVPNALVKRYMIKRALMIINLQKHFKASGLAEEYYTGAPETNQDAQSILSSVL